MQQYTHHKPAEKLDLIQVPTDTIGQHLNSRHDNKRHLNNTNIEIKQENKTAYRKLQTKPFFGLFCSSQ